MIEIITIGICSFTLITSISLFILHMKLRRKAAKFLEEKLHAEERCDQIREEMKDHIHLVVESRLQKYRANFEIESASLLSQALVGESNRDLQQQIDRFIHEKYGRISQELLGTVSDEAEGLVRDLNFELCEKIWDAFQAYKEKAKESPLILPDGIKLAYTKGHRTVIVIEQKPQTRTVTFDAELVKKASVAKEAKEHNEFGYRFVLAFPYVYFVIVFDVGKYKYHELYFRNKPLTSIREHIYLAPIPNVFRDKGKDYKPMCMGADFGSIVREELTVARQSEMVVSDFWQRAFNAELGSGDHESLDPRIKNYAVWQENSAKNPLFILEVPWTKSKTFKGVIESVLDQRSQKHVLDPVDTEIRALLTEGVAKLSERIKVETKKARVKYASLPSALVSSKVRELVEEIVVKHSKKVFNQIVTNFEQEN